MGNKRSFNEYMKMVGIDTLTKKVTVNTWCHRGGDLSCLPRSDLTLHL
jgi:ribulose bisphosphate carboxylase small subunit